MSGEPVRIVIVGSELLSGDVVDRNGPLLARAVSGRGGQVRSLRVVGDRPEDVREAVASALAAGEGVLVCGGLGPTPDDATREAVAAALERPLVQSRAWTEALTARQGGRYTEASATRQSRLPEGARLVPNPHGTAAGFAVETEAGWVVALPGVPVEVRGMLQGEAGGFLDEHLPGETEPSIRVGVAGVPESRLAEALEQMGELQGLEVASYPRGGLVDLVLRVEPAAGAVGGAGEVRRWLRDAAEAVRARLGGDVYEVGDRSLEAVVLDRLRELGETLAVAESCTGGALGAALTSVPGSSDVLWGGAVSYADEAKAELLGVGPGVIERDGAVSEPTARAMAEGVRGRSGADWGVAVTGIAGPTGGTEEKPVGTVWIAVDGRRSYVRRHLFPGDREEIRERSVTAALDAVRRLSAEDGPDG